MYLGQHYVHQHLVIQKDETMGATNNMFHGKRRSLFLGILFSSFWSIFLLFRPFSFFLILIQLRYKCSMCCVGLQICNQIFCICIFRFGSKYIHVLSVLRWLAVKEAVTRRQITDPRRFFTPADHTLATPAQAIDHYWHLERLQLKHTVQQD